MGRFVERDRDEDWHNPGCRGVDGIRKVQVAPPLSCHFESSEVFSDIKHSAVKCLLG